jgi:hypothetical protein
MNKLSRFLLALLMVALAILPWARAQDAAPPPFKKEEIEQFVAPIALYPDSLIAQILMASTYPLEVVSAARWSKANPSVKDKALEDAMQKQTWDPSVKSLTAFPNVLAMMNEKLDMTQKLGDAFLGQQKEVLAAIQRLRAKAQAAGNLKSSKEQTVSTAQEAGTTVIKIEPADPQVVYVPTYNPTVVYGPWPYAAYPPYYYYPPGYPVGAGLAFGVGIAAGAALWGNCNWGGGDVNVNVNKYNNYNKTNISNGNWNHNAEHRKGTQYRDSASQQKYGKDQQKGAQSREDFRGRADQGRQDIARGGADSVKGGAGDRAGGAGDRGGGAGDRGGGAGDRAGGAGDRGGGAGDRAGGAGDRGGAQQTSSSSRQAGGFDGVGQGGQTRAQSDRGASSRASSSSSARSSGGGGAARSGGGGGGGARGGGGGGRR